MLVMLLVVPILVAGAMSVRVATAFTSAVAVMMSMRRTGWWCGKNLSSVGAAPSPSRTVTMFPSAA